MITLHNELLYKAKDRELYKTYCSERQLFGISCQTTAGTKESHPEYAHVFSFDRNGRGAVVTQQGEYKWIDSNLIVTSMSSESENYYATLYRTDSKCNCFGTAYRCGHCAAGIIRSPLNFRQTETVGSADTYVYQTLIGAYRIWIKEDDEVRVRYNFLWEKSDFFNHLLQEVDTVEIQYGKCLDLEWEVCLYAYPNQDVDKVLLIGYQVRVEVIDVNVSASLINNRNHLS